ncbi:MAG TPA: urease accessory protein UreD [Solirubrobacteraceae bacterium]|nr:urease accessory protein UreD [Solirubrobacteraceae bacterium]
MTARVSIAAAAGNAGRTVLTELAGIEPWTPRILAGNGAARVALVQSRASILRGDAVELSITVGEGAALELVEIGATLTHHARRGDSAQVTVDVTVGDGGRLTWLAAPLVIAAGAEVRRALCVGLLGSARALLGETVVLGRAHEPYGCLTSRTRIVGAGRPTLDETLETGDPDTVGSPVVAGSAGVIAALTLAGARDDDPPAGAMQAHGPATLWRATGGAVEVARWTAEVAERWRGVLDGGGEAPQKW